MAPFPSANVDHCRDRGGFNHGLKKADMKYVYRLVGPTCSCPRSNHTFRDPCRIPCKDPTYDPKWHKYQPSLTHPMHTTTCLSRQCITQLYLLYTAPRKQTECYSMRFTGDWQNAEWRKEMGLIHANDNNRARLILDFRGLILIPILFGIFFFCKDPINICNRARIFYSLPTNLTIYNWLKQLTLL